MSKYILIIGIATALFTAPVFAGQCPKHLKYIDDNMMKSSVSSSQMKVVMVLRAGAVKFHNGGDHDASLIALRTATELLELDPL